MADSTPSAGKLTQGLNLSSFDWADADLTDAAFQDCEVSGVNFLNTVLDGATFVRCRLTNCRFSHVEAREISFSGCTLTDAASHKGLAICFSRLEQAKFEACDLSFSSWERSDLYGLDMVDCNMRGSKFYKTDFSKAFGRKPVRTSATFKRCNFHLAELCELDLSGCDFEESLFREADLSASNLEGANLTGADLFGAVHVGAKLANADLRRAEISGLDLDVLGSRIGMRITADQQHALLATLGIDVST